MEKLKLGNHTTSKWENQIQIFVSTTPKIQIFVSIITQRFHSSALKWKVSLKES